MAELPNPARLLGDLTHYLKGQLHHAIGWAVQRYLDRLNRD